MLVPFVNEWVSAGSNLKCGMEVWHRHAEG